MLLRSQKKTVKIIYLFIALSIFFMVGQRISSYFFIWLLGMAVLFLPSIQIVKSKGIMLISFMLVCLAMILRPLVNNGRLFIDHYTNNLFFVDLFIGLLLGIFIYVLMHGSGKETKRQGTHNWIEKTSKLLASFSFSLYLIHYPIINLAYYWGVKNGFSGFQPNLLSVLFELIIVFLICMIAYLFSRVTESRTNDLRIFIMRSIEVFIIRNRKEKERNMETNQST
jgi:peptidoglycan/LPS O-acetylase OafA/YrhL